MKQYDVCYGSRLCMGSGSEEAWNLVLQLVSEFSDMTFVSGVFSLNVCHSMWPTIIWWNNSWSFRTIPVRVVHLLSGMLLRVKFRSTWASCDDREIINLIIILGVVTQIKVMMKICSYKMVKLGQEVLPSFLLI